MIKCPSAADLDLFSADDAAVHLEYRSPDGARRRQCGQADVNGVRTLRIQQSQLLL